MIIKVIVWVLASVLLVYGTASAVAMVITPKDIPTQEIIIGHIDQKM